MSRLYSPGQVTKKEDNTNGRSSESHQVYLNGRVVTDEDEVKEEEERRSVATK